MDQTTTDNLPPASPVAAALDEPLANDRNFARELYNVFRKWERADDAERIRLIDEAAAIYLAYRESDDVSAGPAWDFGSACIDDFLPFLTTRAKAQGTTPPPAPDLRKQPRGRIVAEGV